MSATRSYWIVDLECNETGVQLSLRDIKAYDSAQAERLAREHLNPTFTYRVTAFDRHCAVA